MSWKSWEKASEKGPWSITIKVLVFVVTLTVILGVLGFVMNPFRQAARIVNKTMDADNVITNYEWFKQRHEDIGAIDSKIKSSDTVVSQFKTDAGERADWHREDREEHARLSSVLLGLMQQRADLAAEYNARSRMVNRNIFKAGDVKLPESIPVD